MIESSTPTPVQCEHECRESAALRFASACTAHPGGQKGVARAIGFTTKGQFNRFNDYCTGDRTLPAWLIEAVRLKCPTVFAAWLEGMRRDAIDRTPTLTVDEAHDRAEAEKGNAARAKLEMDRDRRREPHELRALADAHEATARAEQVAAQVARHEADRLDAIAKGAH